MTRGNKFKNKISVLLCLIPLLVVIDLILLGKIKEIDDIKVIHSAADISNEIVFSPDKELTYFYEPEPDKVINKNQEWTGDKYAYYHNSDGLHERKDYSVSKNKGVFRIITLGDSFTYGLSINTRQNWTEILEESLNRNINCNEISLFEVINLGVGGYDLEYALKRFIKTGLKYDPDLIIWLVNNWNFDKINEKYIPVRKALEKKGVPNYNPEEGYASGIAARKVLSNFFGNDGILSYQEKVLIHFRDIYKSDLFIASFPSIDVRYKNKIKKVFPSSSNFLFTEIPNLNSDERLPDLHPNTRGHEKISEEVLKYLLSDYFKECKQK